MVDAPAPPEHPEQAEDDEDLALFEATVSQEQAGLRLDQLLSALTTEQDAPISRAQIQRHIEAGCCRVDGVPALRPARKARAAERVRYAPPAPQPEGDVEPEPIPLDVLFEDEHIVVVNKAAGMVVHPAPGHARGTLVAALLAHCTQLSGVGGRLRPGIVHRLDRLTSGVMVASKSDAAHYHLADQFREHSIDRRYHALVLGTPAARGTFETMHARHPRDRKRFTSRTERGRRAVTHYERLRVIAGVSLVEARLETGRTHQVRVHFADHGHALLGDPVYGRKPKDRALREIGEALARQALHARLLELTHPASGERMRFEAATPADMVAAIAALQRQQEHDAT